MSELLPCPFCGDEGEVCQNVYATVECTQCEAHSAVFYSAGAETNKQRAIDAWNRRAVPEWLNVLIHNARRDADLFRHHEKVSDDRNIALKRGAQAETLEDAIRAAEAWMEGK